MTAFDDVVRGEVAFENANLEDFVLLRSNGAPMFLLANAVDDADMGITHVIRGEDHVNGTPKYLLLAAGARLRRPSRSFAHLPLLVNEQRKKLSKRRDDVSVADYRDRGYLPEAMRNYLALLGWGPPDGVEVRPIDEIVDLFRLEDVTPSPAFFDIKKLDHDQRRVHPGARRGRLRRASREPFLTAGEPRRRAAGPAGGRGAGAGAHPRRGRPDMIDFLWLDEPEVDEASWNKAMVKGRKATAMLDASIDRLGGWLTTTGSPWRSGRRSRQRPSRPAS